MKYNYKPNVMLSVVENISKGNTDLAGFKNLAGLIKL